MRVAATLLGVAMLIVLVLMSRLGPMVVYAAAAEVDVDARLRAAPLWKSPLVPDVPKSNVVATSTSPKDVLASLTWSSSQQRACLDVNTTSTATHVFNACRRQWIRNGAPCRHLDDCLVDGYKPVPATTRCNTLWRVCEMAGDTEVSHMRACLEERLCSQQTDTMLRLLGMEVAAATVSVTPIPILGSPRKCQWNPDLVFPMWNPAAPVTIDKNCIAGQALPVASGTPLSTAPHAYYNPNGYCGRRFTGSGRCAPILEARALCYSDFGGGSAMCVGTGGGSLTVGGRQKCQWTGTWSEGACLDRICGPAFRDSLTFFNTHKATTTCQPHCWNRQRNTEAACRVHTDDWKTDPKQYGWDSVAGRCRISCVHCTGGTNPANHGKASGACVQEPARHWKEGVTQAQCEDPAYAGPTMVTDPLMDGKPWPQTPAALEEGASPRDRCSSLQLAGAGAYTCDTTRPVPNALTAPYCDVSGLSVASAVSGPVPAAGTVASTEEACVRLAAAGVVGANGTAIWAPPSTGGAPSFYGANTGPYWSNSVLGTREWCTFEAVPLTRVSTGTTLPLDLLAYVAALTDYVVAGNVTVDDGFVVHSTEVAPISRAVEETTTPTSEPSVHPTPEATASPTPEATAAAALPQGTSAAVLPQDTPEATLPQDTPSPTSARNTPPENTPDTSSPTALPTPLPPLLPVTLIAADGSATVHLVPDAAGGTLVVGGRYRIVNVTLPVAAALARATTTAPTTAPTNAPKPPAFYAPPQGEDREAGYRAPQACAPGYLPPDCVVRICGAGGDAEVRGIALQGDGGPCTCRYPWAGPECNHCAMPKAMGGRATLYMCAELPDVRGHWLRAPVLVSDAACWLSGECGLFGVHGLHNRVTGTAGFDCHCRPGQEEFTIEHKTAEAMHAHLGRRVVHSRELPLNATAANATALCLAGAGIDQADNDAILAFATGANPASFRCPRTISNIWFLIMLLASIVMLLAGLWIMVAWCVGREHAIVLWKYQDKQEDMAETGEGEEEDGGEGEGGAYAPYGSDMPPPPPPFPEGGFGPTSYQQAEAEGRIFVPAASAPPEDGGGTYWMPPPPAQAYPTINSALRARTSAGSHPQPEGV